MHGMTSPLQDLCEAGQSLLLQTRYLEAEHVLAEAESLAWHGRDYDALARLYMPLQEARRQRRQRCGEGVVCLDLIAQDEHDTLDGQHVVENFSHGQLLVAGWGTIGPALRVRQLQAEHGLYLETFLAAAYPVEGGRAVVIVPAAGTALPAAEPRTLDQLRSVVTPHCLVLREDQLPRGSRRGTWQTYAQVMALWESLHAPFVAAADREADAARRIEGYRRAIEVDYASELAHQKLSDAAKALARRPAGAA